MSVVGIDRHGQFQKFEFSFDANYQKYSVWQGKTDSLDLNLTILPRGVVATIVNDGELVIFVPRNGDMKRVPDKDATTDLHLARWGDKVVAIRDGSVISLSLN